MSRIKVIKRGEIKETVQALKRNDAELKSRQKRREIVKTVENWVNDWRSKRISNPLAVKNF
jgi:hypothetical protein